MQDDKFLENLVSKMAKAKDSKNHGAFLNLKAAFTSLVAKKEAASAQSSGEPKERKQKAEFISFGNIEYLKDAIKIDELARRVRDRWYKTCQDKKIKYPQKNLESKLVSNFESKRLGLQKKSIFVTPEAFYEMMTVGYLPEKITKNKKGFVIPVLSGQEPLVFKTQEEFDKFTKKHEQNFLDDIGKRLSG